MIAEGGGEGARVASEEADRPRGWLRRVGHGLGAAIRVVLFLGLTYPLPGLAHLLLRLPGAAVLIGCYVAFGFGVAAIHTSLLWRDEDLYDLYDPLREAIWTIRYAAMVHPFVVGRLRRTLIDGPERRWRVVGAFFASLLTAVVGAILPAMASFGVGMHVVEPALPNGPPALNGKQLLVQRGAILPGTIQRGDLVWLPDRLPITKRRMDWMERGWMQPWRPAEWPEIAYVGVQRVIALPGDLVRIGGGEPIEVNGVTLVLSDAALRQTQGDHSRITVLCAVEKNLDGLRYPIQPHREYPGARIEEQRIYPDRLVSIRRQEFQVPSGHVFMLRDDRSVATDAQYTLRQGSERYRFIPLDLVTDRVVRNVASGVVFARKTGGVWTNVDRDCDELGSR